MRRTHLEATIDGFSEPLALSACKDTMNVPGPIAEDDFEVWRSAWLLQVPIIISLCLSKDVISSDDKLCQTGDVLLVVFRGIARHGYSCVKLPRNGNSRRQRRVAKCEQARKEVAEVEQSYFDSAHRASSNKATSKPKSFFHLHLRDGKA